MSWIGNRDEIYKAAFAEPIYSATGFDPGPYPAEAEV
ncbi:hypothetical protein FHT71_002744 [Rhizobium sp. BK060]|nr:hypothetical protein [Rhizobium sp. BK060]